MPYRSFRGVRRVAALLCSFLAATASVTLAQPSLTPDTVPTRGQLLYNTHCIECHNVQLHWRANSRVRDWASLLAEVNRWQANAQLAWTDEDIAEVTRHLNDTIYRLPQPQQKAARFKAAR